METYYLTPDTELTYITDAIHMLNDVLRRMAGHQDKKNSLLRALRAWDVDESL